MKINYSKLSIICLTISIISIMIFMTAYHFKAVGVMSFSAGMLIVSMLVHLLINPIDSDDGPQEGEEDGNL